MGPGDHSEQIEDVRAGDWRAFESLYGQLRELKQGEKASRAAVAETTDRLAESIARVFASYEGSEERFLSHLRETMARIDDLEPRSEEEGFRHLYKDESLERFEIFSPPQGVKARPKPFAAAVETVRRIKDLNRIREKLQPLKTTAILGGSLSFGRFFTIQGSYASKRPSDIDLFLVLPRYDEIAAVAEALREAHDEAGRRFVHAEQAATMVRRAAEFDRLPRGEVPTIFQQKLDLWDKPDSPYYSLMGIPVHYSLHVHIACPDHFDYITLKDYARLSDLPSAPLRVRVYRDDKPLKDSEEQYSFSGRHKASPVGKEDATEGYLATVQVCELHDGRFYPGMHLNLLFPQFEVRWEHPEISARLPLLALRYKFVAQLEAERSLYPSEVQRLSFAHARGRQFARRVTQRLDSE